MIDLKRLRELAKKATSGPWYRSHDPKAIIPLNVYREYVKNSGVKSIFNICKIPTRTERYPISHEEYEANADFIAMANPQTILKLLDVVEASKRLSDLWSVLDSCNEAQFNPKYITNIVDSVKALEALDD